MKNGSSTTTYRRFTRVCPPVSNKGQLQTQSRASRPHTRGILSEIGARYAKYSCSGYFTGHLWLNWRRLG